MRIFFITVLLITIWGCKQIHNQESAHFKQTKNWFFWSVEWHPSKDQFVVGGSNDSFLVLFSSSNLKQIKSYPHQGTITKTKWHPTKNTLAISVQDGKSNSTIFNLDNGDIVELDSITIEGARSIGWNHSGEMLAVGDNNGYITLYNEEGNLLNKIDTGQKGIMSLDWHPKENLIVAVGEKITLYDFQLDKQKHIKPRNEDILMLCAAWHPSGEFFVTGDYGDSIDHYPPLLQYWTYEGQRIKAIQESKAEIRNISWSDDGALLATASEKIRLYDINGNLIAEEKSEDLLWGIDWNKDSSKLVATDVKGKILFWDRSLKSLSEIEY